MARLLKQPPVEITIALTIPEAQALRRLLGGIEPGRIPGHLIADYRLVSDLDDGNLWRVLADYFEED